MAAHCDKLANEEVEAREEHQLQELEERQESGSGSEYSGGEGEDAVKEMSGEEEEGSEDLSGEGDDSSEGPVKEGDGESDSLQGQSGTFWIAQLVEDIAAQYTSEAEFEPSAIHALQEAAEAWLVQVFRLTNLYAEHDDRVTIQQRDMQLVFQIQKAIFGSVRHGKI